MAFDEGLAQRVRELLFENPYTTEKKMFGGLCFMISGNMCVGILGEGMVVRFGPPQHDYALSLSHTRVFDFTGKPMKGWIMVDAQALTEDDELKFWVSFGEQFASALVPK